MATTSYENIDFDADDFTLPARIDADFASFSQQRSNPPATAPIQIDEEVVVKNKRRPTVKLVDR